ncbi:DUF5689 domain-containing protein [Ulvibacter litoralis]|uniref:DUF5689 domain-containing protein n=1 Tax=Ulvibacter litoralis TaxID=227084 RepID=A0A1G7D0D2_9FLAO|nr:DUF5689 domain-containing protein [Ulvibacter litoralis]GHC45524.1 hypothetical protein GCM10008083_05450 [Ulvibacter litoralis]SDE44490.1 protein of unknown function [Ulvibacter litoralis]
MKNFKNIKFLSILFIVGSILVSCVKGDDYDIPEINVEEPNVDVNFDIAAVKGTYQGFEPVLIEAGAGSTDPLYIEAYVISSDETGNFYKQLVIQDLPENPTAGLSISTEAQDLYTRFEPGRKVYIRVDGLFIGEYAGLPTLGIQDGSDVGRISIAEFEERVLRSTETATLVPTVITMEQAQNESRLNTLVQFENVQFPSSLAGQSYANIDNNFSVNRVVEDCEENQVILRNSGYSTFKNKLLPEGNGTLTAVLSIFNSDYQTFIRDTDDVNMEGDRCAQALFEENFEGLAVTGNGEYIDLPGWTNVNVNGGEERYEAREFSNNKYAQITAFGSGEDPLDAWLVTPGFTIPAGNSAASINFGTKDGYNNGEALTVLVSTDFSGDVTTATWTDLNATISTGNTSGYAANFTSSGDLDLSAYIGQEVFIGFKYAGADGGITTTYQIDNISFDTN